jgi:hypothetical protein
VEEEMKDNRRILTIGLIWVLLTSNLFGSRAQQAHPSAAKAPAKSRESMVGRKDGKFALLIGINKYLYMKPLRGAVRDVREMKKLLTSAKFGFDPVNVAVIEDGHATAENIIKGFRELIEKARRHKEKTGDEAVVYFHYSGHGSQVPSDDPKEPDKKDETIVPVNSRDKENKNWDIIDDEIESLIEELAKYTSRATYVFDSCHSGTINRGPLDIYADIARKVDEDTRPQPKRRYIEREESKAQSRDEFLGPGEKYALIAASQSAELAYEKPTYSGQGDHGWLTYYLLQELRQAKPTTTYRELMNRVAVAVTQNSPYQHPQFLGEASRTVLGGAISDEDYYIPVTNVEKNKITVGAGAAMGVKIGTLVAIYEPETLRLAGEKGKLVEGEVTGVTGNEAVIALPDNFDSSRVTLDARAALVSPLFGAEPMPVMLEPPGTERGGPTAASEAIVKLIERLKKSKLVKSVARAAGLTRGGDEPRVEGAVYVRHGKFGEVFHPEKPEPLKDENGKIKRHLPKDDAEVFYLSSGRGAPIFDFYVEATSSGAGEQIVEALEKLARQNNLKAIENRISPINDAIEVNFVKVTGELDPSGKFIPDSNKEAVLPMPNPPDELVIPTGVYFKLRIRNKSERPIYITALNISTDGAIHLMYPRSGQEPLSPGKDVDTAIFITSRPYGREVCKVIATREKSDFGPLAQGGVRTRNDDHPLGRLMEQALTGTRSGPANVAYDNSDWGVTQLSFTIKTPGQ